MKRFMVLIVILLGMVITSVSGEHSQSVYARSVDLWANDEVTVTCVTAGGGTEITYEYGDELPSDTDLIAQAVCTKTGWAIDSVQIVDYKDEIELGYAEDDEAEFTTPASSANEIEVLVIISKNNGDETIYQEWMVAFEIQ